MSYLNYESKRNKQNPYYKLPLSSSIKLIDFGSAVNHWEKHSSEIQTRHYRAPEVTLQLGDWDYKADIWSVACVLSELYSGYMLFPTHNPAEHVAMIEKLLSRPIPRWMAEEAQNEDFFDVLIYNKKWIRKNKSRIDINRINDDDDRNTARRHLKNFETLDVSQI